MTTLSAAAATIDVPELSDLSHDKVLASARFMKSVRAKSQSGFVFVKAIMKPYSTFDIRSYVRQLTEERNALASVPNALGYQRIVEVADGGFLVRQYMFSSVYDRLSTRPFLEDIEKRWLSYQLLRAVQDCHAQNLYHGDIKTENLLVTSWNWLYLTDFSSCFKPTTLPEDNPADFTFYFDTSSRRICYVAPERFSSQSSDEGPQDLNWAMDLFSVGCVIAEIFLEGPIFTLSQIFKYKAGEYNPEDAHIHKIEDGEVKAMILNMIELDPEKRYSAEQHLSFYRSKIFPEYFYSFLHDYMHDLTEPVLPAAPLPLDADILTESDRKIETVFQDFDKISYFLGYSDNPNLDYESNQHASRRRRRTSTSASDVHIENALHDGTLLFLTLVSSAIRNTAKASARLKACDLLTSFALRLPDEAKLDRILPYVVGLLSDRSDAVKVAALHATTSILDLIRVVSPINAYLFPEYLFPKLNLFLTNGQSQPSAVVRAAYASCLATLALASSRMLDMVQAIRADGRMPALSHDTWGPDTTFHALYDVARAELIPRFEEATTLLITDQDTSVRRALLGSVSRLCLFFGSARSSDVVLSHLNTYLNEPDWILRCAFYDALVGVATYVGTSSLEQFIIPIMVGSMTDSEHFVVAKVIQSFARMAALGLFQRATLWDLSGMISRYLVHPSYWIKEAAAQFVEQACKFLSNADRYCIMLPILQPFLRAPLLDFSEQSILDKLKSPLSRAVFEATVLWAAKREQSLFWTAASRDGMFMTAHNEMSLIPSNLVKRFPHRIPPSQRDKDDQHSLETLRIAGMVPDDEVKLIALREYILKYSQLKAENSPEDKQKILGDIVSLAQLSVTPQNVFFDAVQPFRPATRLRAVSKSVDRNGARTIADALMDASTTIDPATPESMPPTVEAGPTKPKPMPTGSLKSHVEAQTPASVKIGSFDRPNIRIEGIKGENGRRSSSVGGRHALLDAERFSSERRELKLLKHRNSSANLLNRAEIVKADAEISTSQETVFGKIDKTVIEGNGERGSSLTHSLNATQKSRSKSPMSSGSGRTRFEANHDYRGNEATVIRLLDTHLTDNFPVDLLDFGAQITPIDTEMPIRSATTPNPQPGQVATAPFSGNKEIWRPSGLLLAQLIEHTAAINRVVVAPDHSFFVTASDDGTCKIWDTSRLEKNVSARSRYTHRHTTGSKVKALCFIENTHTFLSGATDGSIHAVKLEIKPPQGNEPARFGRPAIVRDWQIPQHSEPSKQTDLAAAEGSEQEHAVWIHHYREHNSNSTLMIATNKCRILMVDMKNMELIRAMQNPLHHGTPTTFCVDPKHHWFMLGTSHGILDLWDLRFSLRLRSFGVGGAGLGQRIDSVLLHPTRGHGKWILVSCGGEVSIWDIEKLTCREVLRPATFKLPQSRKIKNYEPWYPDEENSESMLSRFATQVERGDGPLQTPQDGKSKQDKQAPSITSILMFDDCLVNQSSPDTPTRTPLLLSVGEDRTLRYWNPVQYDQSFIVSGPMVNIVGDENKIKPRYETSWPTSMSLSGLVQLIEEKLSDPPQDQHPDGTASNKHIPRKKRDAARGSRAISDGSKSNANNKTPRNTIISLAQEQMLKTHMDDITDVCLLRKPYGCIVSVDRSGAIFVFH